MEGQRAALFKCQRIGCNAMFSDDDNPEGSCQYHDSGPIFHDGIKEWSCCKKRSHDFTLFLELPGCKTGKHTTEKPVLAKPKPKAPVPAPSPTAAPATDASSKQSCSRCRQGFFCSEHGAQAKELKSKPVNVETTPIPEGAQAKELKSKPVNVETTPIPEGAQAKELKSKPVNVETTPIPEGITDDQGTSAPLKKIVDINQPLTCTNKGCGQTFKEKDNHENACSYHPGPAIFHDRVRGWKCCDVHVKEFDEFMSIPPCTKGWHNADPVS